VNDEWYSAVEMINHHDLGAIADALSARRQ
jgi:hypothetical protein